MIDLAIIKRELFVTDCTLLNTTNTQMLGVPTHNDTICYFVNDYGYVFYLPNRNVGTGRSLFDPQSPVSFRWTLFNKQIIFVPLKEMPLKTMVFLHPQPSKITDVLVRFNFEYHNRYNHCFVDAVNPKEDYYFLLRDSNELITDVMPEFLRSNSIGVEIDENNIDEIWRHWLAVECYHRMDGYKSGEHYLNMYKNSDWIDNIISELLIKNLTMKPKPKDIDDLDIGLQKLLGYRI